VTTPIRNDTPIAANPERKLRTRPRGAEQPQSQTTVGRETEATHPEAREGGLGQVTHSYGNSVQQERNGTLPNPLQGQSEARSLLGRLKAQIAGNPAGAMAVFGQFNRQQTAILLQQGSA